MLIAYVNLYFCVISFPLRFCNISLFCFFLFYARHFLLAIKMNKPQMIIMLVFALTAVDRAFVAVHRDFLVFAALF